MADAEKTKADPTPEDAEAEKQPESAPEKADSKKAVKKTTKGPHIDLIKNEDGSKNAFSDTFIGTVKQIYGINTFTLAKKGWVGEPPLAIAADQIPEVQALLAKLQ